MSKWIAALGLALTLALAALAWSFSTSERLAVVETRLAAASPGERLRAIERLLATQTEQLRGLSEKIDELRQEVRELK